VRPAARLEVINLPELSTEKAYPKAVRKSSHNVPTEKASRESPWFAILPLSLAKDRRLGKESLWVYAVLYRLTRHKPEASVSIRRLAALTGLSPRATHRGLTKLIAAGWVERIQGDHGRNAYRVKREKPYIHVPFEILTDFPRSALVVYGLLRLLRDRNDTAYPSTAYLVAITGYRKSQVMEALRKLREAGWIEVRHLHPRRFAVLDEYKVALKRARAAFTAPTPNAKPANESALAHGGVLTRSGPRCGHGADLGVDTERTLDAGKMPMDSSKTDPLSSRYTSTLTSMEDEVFRLGAKALDHNPDYGMGRKPSVSPHPTKDKVFPPKCGDDPTSYPGTTTLGVKVDELSLLAAVIADLDAQIEALSAALSSAESEEERRGLEAEKLALVVEKKGYEERLARLLGQAPRGLLISEESLARYAPLEV